MQSPGTTQRKSRIPTPLIPLGPVLFHPENKITALNISSTGEYRPRVISITKTNQVVCYYMSEEHYEYAEDIPRMCFFGVLDILDICFHFVFTTTMSN